MMRHLPNLLSALRLMAGAAGGLGWYCSDHDTAALAVFAAAGLERSAGRLPSRGVWVSRSRFGAWLDPAADKLLMLFCFCRPAAARRGAALAGGAGAGARCSASRLGVGLAWALSLPLRIAPLVIGKATTAVQIGYIGVWPAAAGLRSGRRRA